MYAQHDQRSGYRTASHEQCRPISSCRSPVPVRDLAEARRNSEVGPPIQWEGGSTQATVHNAAQQRPSGYPHPRDVALRDLMGPVTLGGSNDRNSNKCTNGTSLIMRVSVKHSCPAVHSRRVMSPKFHRSGMVTGVLTRESQRKLVTGNFLLMRPPTSSFGHFLAAIPHCQLRVPINIWAGFRGGSSYQR